MKIVKLTAEEIKALYPEKVTLDRVAAPDLVKIYDTLKKIDEYVRELEAHVPKYFVTELRKKHALD